jgi:hypothetical protein
MKGGMTARTPRSRTMRWPATRRAPRYGVPVLVSVLIVIVVGLVALSPFALGAFGNGPEWAQRSEIGQTYRAAAALLSVLALVGISFSLILQAREAKAAREHASRLTHTDLLQLAMDDPVYRECWGPAGASRNEREQRQHIYTNLIISYWQSRFEVGMFSEAHLRAGAARMFSAAPGRRFWATTRRVRREVAQTRRARRFHEILDEEYENAIAAGPPERPTPRGKGRRMPRLIVGAGAIAAAPLLHRALTRRRT